MHAIAFISFMFIGWSIWTRHSCIKKRIAPGKLLILFLASISTLISNTSLVHCTDVSGYISTDTIWTLSGSPYIVVGDIIVEGGVALYIEPGVIVKFCSETNLVVDGSLIAEGTFTHRITFTSNATSSACMRIARGNFLCIFYPS